MAKKNLWGKIVCLASKSRADICSVWMKMLLLLGLFVQLPFFSDRDFLSQESVDSWQGGHWDHFRPCGEQRKGPVQHGSSEGVVHHQVPHCKQGHKLHPLHLLHGAAQDTLFHSGGWEKSDQSVSSIPLSWWDLWNEKKKPNIIKVCWIFNSLFSSSGESYDVSVRYMLNHYGFFPATMYFEFCPDLAESVPFCIVREMEAVARTPLAVELGPVAPYKPFQVVTYRPVNTVIVEGVPPER